MKAPQNGVSLHRRRGTKASPRSRLLQNPIFVLFLIAVLLALGLLLLLALAGNPNLPVEESKVRPGKLPGIPNFFRGRLEPHQVAVPVDTKAASLADAAGNLNAANGPPPVPEKVNLNRYDTPPTKVYPYPLTVVPEEYDISHNFVVLGGNRYTEYTTGGTPYLITPAVQQDSDTVARSRRFHVKAAMQHAWQGYTQYAFGADEVKPISGSPSNNWGGQGITLVDALDTLWLMDMKDEFYKCRDWVRDHLNHGSVNQAVSVFETTIRDLGGLLAAYDWSGEEVFKEKALELGKLLLKAYDGSPTGIPFGQVNLAGGGTSNLNWAGGNVILAELGTVQVENRYLSHVTGEKQFAEKTEHVFEIMNEMATPNGLYPYFVRNAPRGKTKPQFANDKLTFGAMADSFYEYMLKIWIQGGKTEPLYRSMYDKAMDGMHAELLQTSTPSGLTYIADKNGGTMDHKMDHLVCFMGGLLALGAYTDPSGGLESPRAQRDLRTAKALTYTCYQMYARMNTGISPEFIQFSTGSDFIPGRGAPHYLLRPEAVESFFILHQLTGDPVYREWGWEVFQAIEKYCKTPIAYGELANVQDTSGQPRDKMESFFLAETLKYSYLLQDPDTEVDILNKHVFNTEAHPTRILPLVEKK